MVPLNITVTVRVVVVIEPVKVAADGLDINQAYRSFPSTM
jgi:hypothetical protein